jgi:diguanylate cyclase (GGDEF)-like protein
VVNVSLDVLEKYAHSLPALVSLVDMSGKVVYANERHLQLLGVGETLPELREEADLYPDSVASRLQEPLFELVREKGEYEWELNVQHKDGKPHHYRICHRIIEDNTGLLYNLAFGWEQSALIEQPDPDFERKSQLSYLTFHDPVTGLANRSLFYDRVQKSLGRARRHNGKIALLLIDLDRFKNINDLLGRDSGDLFLRHVAQCLSEAVRDTDTVARLGADEFVIVLENISSASDIEIIAQKLQESLVRPIEIDGHEVSATASIGISLFPKDGDSVDQLLKNADMAMYRAKSAGKNRHQFFIKAMTDSTVNYLLLENDLKKAIENNELSLNYQPQVNLHSGRINGVEALVRWQHPERGMISPVEFIPLAEETGLIEPLGDWVLKTACQTFQSWLMQGLKFGKIAVNLSPRQFRQEHFEQRVMEVITETRLPPQYLELEITESSAMENAAETVSTLKCLSQMGLSLAIDDFGTGYSSLSYLKRFPIQKLKIDRSFINDVDTDDTDAAIAKSIIDLAHNMSLKVVAEGVERPSQSRWLIDKGCDQVQGFYYAKPLSEQDLLELSNDKNRAFKDELGVRLII